MMQARTCRLSSGPPRRDQRHCAVGLVGGLLGFSEQGSAAAPRILSAISQYVLPLEAARPEHEPLLIIFWQLPVPSWIQALGAINHFAIESGRADRSEF